MRKGKVMATGSKTGSSADVTLLWKKVMQAVGFAGYLTEQSFVSSNNELINVEGCAIIDQALQQTTAQSLVQGVSFHMEYHIVGFILGTVENHD